MSFFDKEKNVEEYIKMTEGFDGRDLINKLIQYLPQGSTILEIGMGPGHDLNILNTHYQATGSDLSQLFIERYKALHPTVDLMKLDAVTLDTKNLYQGLYSNKVLHHLTKNELNKSLVRQTEILDKNGIALHSFWHGDKEKYIDDLRFVYYTFDDLQSLIPAGFEIVEHFLYKEIEDNDSICLILKKS